MYRNHLKWRIRYGADTILEEFPKSDWFDFLCQHYPASHSDKKCPKILRARDGSHLAIETMGNLNYEALTSGLVPLDEVIRYHIWSMELNEQTRRNFFKEQGSKFLNQAVVIEDLQGLGLGHLNMMFVIKKFSDIDSVNYPDMLRKVFVLNVPPVFGMIWNGVRYIWSAGQQDRMQFISSGSTDLSTELLKLIGPDNLPKEYGGELDYMPPQKQAYDVIMEQLKALPTKKYIDENIPRSDKFEKVISVNEKSEFFEKSLEYEFKTSDEILFSVFFISSNSKQEVIYESEKFNSNEIPTFGRFLLNRVGSYTLCWSNDSWTRSKTLSYSTKIL